MITEKHKLSWQIGKMLGLNIIKDSKIPDTGYCKKHGHYTLCAENSIVANPIFVVFKCPYCLAEKKNWGVK